MKWFVVQFYFTWEKNNSLSYLVNIFKNVARKTRFDRCIMPTFLLNGFKKMVLDTGQMHKYNEEK